MARVLIVDDHAILRRGVRGILAGQPQWQFCGEAETGEAAIQIISQLQPDIIVMDVSMPGIGGIKATQIIHKLYSGVKVILFTLYSSVELLRAGFAAGALGYVLKSDLEDELLRALETVDRGEYFVTSAINPILAADLKEQARQKRGSLDVASGSPVKNVKA